MPLLLGALGSLAAPVIGSLFGKGLQVAAQQRPYSRVPRGNGLKKSFRNKRISNFDVMNWVKELKIKNVHGVFSKDSRRWASHNNNCGIINLDSNNGPGTHWACYVDSFYFDPFGLPPPGNIRFIKRYSTLQYQEKIYFLCGYFCLFFSLKKFRMVIQFVPFCIRF